VPRRAIPQHGGTSVIEQKAKGKQPAEPQIQGGQGRYPVPNNTYNIMQVLVSKLEAIEAYGKYMNDADQHTKQLFQRFMEQDRADVHQLMDALKACMR
jgi:hypothetical protein